MVYREGRTGHRLLDCLFQHDHHRRSAHSKSLDSLPLGRPTFPSPITYWRSLLVTWENPGYQSEFIALAISTATDMSAIVAWIITNTLARQLKTAVSVGEKAVEWLKAKNR